MYLGLLMYLFTYVILALFESWFLLQNHLHWKYTKIKLEMNFSFFFHFYQSHLKEVTLYNMCSKGIHKHCINSKWHIKQGHIWQYFQCLAGHEKYYNSHKFRQCFWILMIHHSNSSSTGWMHSAIINVFKMCVFLVPQSHHRLRSMALVLWVTPELFP